MSPDIAVSKKYSQVALENTVNVYCDQSGLNITRDRMLMSLAGLISLTQLPGKFESQFIEFSYSND